MDPNIHRTSKPRRGRRREGLKILSKRVMSIAENFDVGTQRTRAKLIHELEALAELAQQKAIDTHPKKWKEKQNWTRLAAYISQVINGISKTYDQAEIKVQIRKLREMIDEEKKHWLAEAGKP